MQLFIQRIARVNAVILTLIVGLWSFTIVNNGGQWGEVLAFVAIVFVPYPLIMFLVNYLIIYPFFTSKKGKED